MCKGTVLVYGPSGEATRTNLKDHMTVKELKETALNDLHRIPAQSKSDLQVTFKGKTLVESSLLSKCGILSSSVIHLVLKVRGG